MNPDQKEGKPKRSKVMRFILLAIALAYFWASRYEVTFDLKNEKILRYNKWTGTVDVRNLPLSP